MFCTSSHSALYFCKVSWKDLKRFSSYGADMIFLWRRDGQTGIQELWFLCSACCLVVLYICIQFHENNSNGFQITKRKRVWLFSMFNGPQLRKQQKPELWFLRSARPLMGLYISVKFHEKISNGFQVTKRTWFCYGQTDGHTVGEQYVFPPCRWCEGGGGEWRYTNEIEEESALKEKNLLPWEHGSKFFPFACRPLCRRGFLSREANRKSQ